MHTLLTNYTNWMKGITDLVGVPLDKVNNYVAYLSADLHIRYGGYGIGYPQVNDLAPANNNGPQLSGFDGANGAANYWFVVNPMMGATFYHELGHQIFGGPDQSFYRGEGESMVHVAYTYARNAVYGDDIDTAFSNSINVKDECERTNHASPSPGCQSYKQNQNRVPVMSIDDAAIDWVVRENFRNTYTMDTSGSPTNEIRYQYR